VISGGILFSLLDIECPFLGFFVGELKLLPNSSNFLKKN
jgi:hypothetical protein